MKMQTVLCTVSLDCDGSPIEAVKRLFPSAKNVQFLRHMGEGKIRFDLPASKADAVETLFPGYVHLPQPAELQKPVRRLRNAS